MVKKRVLISFLLFLSLFICAACGNIDTATSEAEPPSLSVAADPETIQLGESTTLSWSSTGADSCVIEPGIGNVAADGSIALSPAQTTTYTITGTGSGGSSSESVRVTVINPGLPVSIQAEPESIQAGDAAVLSWTSTNADYCVIEPGIGSVEPSGSIGVSPAQTTEYTITATGPAGTASASATVTVIHPAPSASISADQTSIMAGETALLSWSSAHADSAVIDNGIGSVSVNGATTVSPAATTSYTISVTGPGGTATDSVAVNVNDPAPVIISAAPTSIEQGGSSILSWTSANGQSAHIDNGIGVVDVNGSITVYPDHTTTYTISVMGVAGSASAQAVVTVMGNPEPQQKGSFGEQYEDLIPPDATLESYDPKRFSLITGLVQDLAAAPITDVAITIHDHPEYGSALTDADGRFSIPAEGGATITVVCQKAGLISAHRKIYVPWNDIAIIETIQMIAEDPATTTVTFDGNPNTVVAHQSTEVTDAFGSRSCTMVFAGDNRAYLTDEQGNDIQELATITTRATEFTTPESMPAKLPPNSAYTYCAELSVDGAQRVRFDKPVITWVDNFLGFDVGSAVPVGCYDRDRGVWVPYENGVVVQLMDTDSNGIVDALDADGNGQPNDLNNNGSFSDEVTGLGDSERYAPGSTFWRVAVPHFSPWDCNWPYGPPQDSISPNPESEPDADQQKDEEKECKTGNIASFVEERSRIFHEDIPIPGTDITLHYASNRVQGYKTVIDVPASGNTVPASLKRIIVNVNLAGRTLKQILEPLPNQKAAFVWDGLDHLGRPVSGSAAAHVKVGFVYDVVYLSPGNVARAFAQAGSDVTGIRARQEVTSWKRDTLFVGAKISSIAEGWTLSAHHHMIPMTPSVLNKGDGTTIRNNAHIIETVAGNGTLGYSGDGGPAAQAELTYPCGVAVDGSGNLYIADRWNWCIRKVDTSGIITTVAGDGAWWGGYSGDGGPAAQAKLDYPCGVAVDGSGNLYIADTFNHCIRKVDTSGIITTVAGDGTLGYSGAGGPADQAELNWPDDVTVDGSGNLYIADTINCCVRKVDTSGIITTVAGDGTRGYSGDGGPATQAKFYDPHGVAVDASGNLYIADRRNHCIRKVDTSGIITTVAGDGTDGYSGDGGPAAQAKLDFPRGVAVDGSGNLYIADTDNDRIRKVDTSGIITTVAGDGTYGYSGDGGPAAQAELKRPYGVAVDGSGNLYISDMNNDRIRKVGSSSAFAGTMTAGVIPFADANGLGYIMSCAGLHKETIDIDTGTVLYEFGYDDDDNLVSITDRFANRTTIDRDGSGVPIAIISADGITTGLTTDANNHLISVTYPDNSFYSFEYTSDGLMTAKIEPEANGFEHEFDSSGRLTDATDDEGGRWQFVRSVQENGDILYRKLTGEGNLTSYLDHTYSTGAYASTIIDPTGSETLFSQSADGLTTTKSLPCGMELIFEYGVDSEYKFKYLKQMHQSTPSALEKVTLREKTYEDTDANDIPDLITETVTVNGNTTTLSHDVFQSRKTVTSPEGRTLTLLYDPDTLLTTSVTIPGPYDTTYGYDARGRLTSTSANTRATTFAYNAQGFLESITDPENQTTIYTYDAVGRMTAINRSDNTTVGFEYDQNGNMTLLTNPSDIDHGFGYNLVNLKSVYRTPLSGSYSYIYDKDRRLIRTNFPSGSQINNVYDTTRLVQIQTPEGNIDLSYLCGTKPGSITNGTDTITYGYDGKLVTSETLTGTLNQSLVYSYNHDFNVQDFGYAGNTHAYTYDNDGLLTGAGAFSIARNSTNGLPEAVTGGALNLTRTFNGYGEVDDQAFSISSATLTSWNLTRDNAGRITARTETVEGVTSDYGYTYDAMGRLLTVTKDGAVVEEYEYDPVGTRIYENNVLRGISERDYVYSDEDCLLTAGGVSYEYNADGFLTTKTEGADVTIYDYSSRGELLGVTLPDGTLVDYLHDPLGRRIAKKVNGSVTEKYLWQGLTRLLAVFDGTDNLIMRFEYADARMPVAMTKDGSTYYLTYDQVGSLRIVADTAANVLKRIEYDSFGNIIQDTNPSFAIPFGFAGGLHDRDTGLVRFGYRDYDPDTGRWTAKDPIGFAGGDTDLYGYCLNDPVNLMDPWGLSAIGDIASGIKKAIVEGTKGGAYSLGEAGKFVGATIKPSEQLLSNTEQTAMIFATASLVTGDVPVAGVFTAIGGLATALKSSLYSDSPCNDAIKEGAKAIIPAPIGLDPVKNA
ncbi:MAG: sugar-binding protein, partial [Deltaproteobacteria bacterium]|nr:sugar-binding protein [Deltaproteobacteria bacterium]